VEHSSLEQLSSIPRTILSGRIAIELLLESSPQLSPGRVDLMESRMREIRTYGSGREVSR
jgi:hypothetical protein